MAKAIDRVLPFQPSIRAEPMGEDRPLPTKGKCARPRPGSAKNWGRRSDQYSKSKQDQMPNNPINVKVVNRNEKMKDSCDEIQCSIEKTRSRSVFRSSVSREKQLETEIVSLKNTLNICREENRELKAAAYKAEKAIQDRDTLIKELKQKCSTQSVSNGANHSPIKGSSTLLINLKQQINLQRRELLRADEEKQEILRYVKFTKLNEVQIELKAALEECQRLRKMLEEILREKYPSEEQMSAYKSSLLIKRLKAENEELIKNQQKLEQEVVKWKDRPQRQSRTRPGKSRKKLKIVKGINVGEKSAKEAQQYIGEILQEKDQPSSSIVQKKQLIKRLEDGKNNNRNSLDSEIRLIKENMAKYFKDIQQLKKPVKQLPIVTDSEMQTLAVEIRLALIRGAVPSIEKLFESYEPTEVISLHEFDRMLRRKPLNVPKTTSRSFARYIIEPRTQPIVEFNELLEDKIENVISKMCVFIPPYVLLDTSTISTLKKSISRKVNLAALQEVDDPDLITLEEFRALAEGMQLTQDESDYLLLGMYKVSGSLERLPLKILDQEFREISGVYTKEIHMEEEKGEVDLIMGSSSRKAPHSVSGHLQEEHGEFDQGEEPQEIDEDQMIDIAQKCFVKIADKMLEKKLTLAKLFTDNIFKKEIDGEQVELIEPNEFVNGLRRLDIPDLQDIECACLVKVLAINDEEKFIRVNELAQVLEDYGITQDETSKPKASKMHFEDLDSISMIIMLALTEYLIKAKVPLYELLGDKVYKQMVQTKSSKKTVDLIDSHDFFGILQDIGIKIEDEEHENLKDFLGIDQNYRDKISLNKLRKTIEEFAFNEELREKAHQYYQELAEEGGEEVEEEGDTSDFPPPPKKKAGSVNLEHSSRSEGVQFIDDIDEDIL